MLTYRCAAYISTVSGGLNKKGEASQRRSRLIKTPAASLDLLLGIEVILATGILISPMNF